MANQESAKRSKRRVATLYDAVAGRVGPNGFLTTEQQQSSSFTPYRPEEVLRRSISSTDQVFDGVYNADEQLKSSQRLPDSDLIKAVHSYTSDFYDMATPNKGLHDFRSFDETALLAFGILLEEAARETLGETGDMALVEPEGLELGLPESNMIEHQIQGRVMPISSPEPDRDSTESDEGRTKRQKLSGNMDQRTPT